MTKCSLPLRVGCRLTLLAVFAYAIATSPVVADEPAPNRRTARFEIKFMKMMIGHHNMAVEMASLCADRAVHPELESLCQDIIAAQTAEIADMQSWLEDWYDISYEPRMTGRDRKDLRELAELDGEEFEIEFLHMMIHHHTEAIEQGEDCVDRAFHDELLELCHNIIATQSDEIALMEEWLCQWYDTCH